MDVAGATFANTSYKIIGNKRWHRDHLGLKNSLTWMILSQRVLLDEYLPVEAILIIRICAILLCWNKLPLPCRWCWMWLNLVQRVVSGINLIDEESIPGWVLPTIALCKFFGRTSLCLSQYPNLVRAHDGTWRRSALLPPMLHHFRRLNDPLLLASLVFGRSSGQNLHLHSRNEVPTGSMPVLAGQLFLLME